MFHRWTCVLRHWCTTRPCGALAAAFKLLDVDVIEAGAQPENTASLAVMHGRGMKFNEERMVYAPARKREELAISMK